MKEIKVLRRKREILATERQRDIDEYWHSILNPYTSKPRFKNFLKKKDEDPKALLKAMFK